jgi:protein O-mannosyl-transferase
VPLIIALVTFAVFLPVLRNDFLTDDGANITNNPHFRGLGLEQLKWMFSTFHRRHYRPLTWVTLCFGYLLWGLDPFGYHLSSIAIHSLNAALFFVVTKRLLTLALPEALKRNRGT